MVGKDSLSEDQKCTLEVAKIIREVPWPTDELVSWSRGSCALKFLETVVVDDTTSLQDFLQQNGFTEYDFMCPLAKTIGMMKVIATWQVQIRAVHSIALWDSSLFAADDVE